MCFFFYGIYHVPFTLNDTTQEHALLVVARGVLDDGVDRVCGGSEFMGSNILQQMLL